MEKKLHQSEEVWPTYNTSNGPIRNYQQCRSREGLWTASFLFAASSSPFITSSSSHHRLWSSAFTTFVHHLIIITTVRIPSIEISFILLFSAPQVSLRDSSETAFPSFLDETCKNLMPTSKFHNKRSQFRVPHLNAYHTVIFKRFQPNQCNGCVFRVELIECFTRKHGRLAVVVALGEMVANVARSVARREKAVDFQVSHLKTANVDWFSTGKGRIFFLRIRCNVHSNSFNIEESSTKAI